jgi:hypothetical protein
VPAASLYVLGPVIAFGVIAGLAAVLRWTFDEDAVPPPGPAEPVPDDFGLLRPASTVDDRATAKALARTLKDAGIRATIGTAPDGRYHVLVFATQLDRARRYLPSA